MDIKTPEEFVEAANNNRLESYMDITDAWRQGFKYENTLKTDTQEAVRTALARQYLPRFLPGPSVIKLVFMFIGFFAGVYGMHYLMSEPGVNPDMPEFVGYAVPVIIGGLCAAFVAFILDFELDEVTLHFLKPRPTKSLDNPLGGQLRYTYKTGHVEEVYGSNLESYMELLRESTVRLKECKLTNLHAVYFGNEPRYTFALDAYLVLTGFLACKKEMPLALEVATNPGRELDKETVRKAMKAVVEYTGVALEPAYQAFKMEQVGDIERSKKQSKLIAEQIDADLKRAMAPKLGMKDIEL